MRKLVLYENITDDELKKMFEDIRHTVQRLDYIRRYYTERKAEYEIRNFSSSDKKLLGKIEVFKNRDIKKHEIDEALFFINKGYDVTLLPEGEIQHEKNVDALFNSSFLVEFRQVKTDKAKNIADEIRRAANKGNSEIISVFFIENAINTQNDRILYEVNEKIRKGDFTGEFDSLLLINSGKITHIKNMVSSTKVNTYHD